MIKHLFTFTPGTVFSVTLGGLWAWMQPTLNWLLICTAAVIVDCISAIRLNRRIRRKYGPKASDGKIKSQHMFQMIDDLCIVYLCILIGYAVNTVIFPDVSIPIGKVIAGLFTGIELCSVFENESSCNGHLWARAVQKWVVDKTKRHLDIDLDELKKEQEEEESPLLTSPKGEEPENGDAADNV